MADSQIHIAINSRYRVFDRSGKLPFSIVLGLSRRSSKDTNPLPLVVNTRETILDIPYALSSNLLSLRVQKEDSKLDVEVDVSQLKSLSNEEKSSVTLPSPVGHSLASKNPLVIHEYHLDPESELASLLEAGKKYRIRVKHHRDFGGDGHRYVDDANPDNEQSNRKKGPSLVIGRIEGSAIFTVLPSLPWPPKIRTTMRRYPSDEDAGVTQLEITVLNTDTRSATVQTRGRQNILLPWGPVYEEDEWSNCPRIIDAQRPSPSRTIQIINMNDNSIIRKPAPPGGFQQGPIGDRRPKLGTLVTMRPGEPLVRRVDVSDLLSDLADGAYGLRMEPRGMWWCEGDWNGFSVHDNERVPQNIFQTMIPPLVLECRDTVEVHIKNSISP